MKCKGSVGANLDVVGIRGLLVLHGGLVSNRNIVTLFDQLSFNGAMMERKGKLVPKNDLCSCMSDFSGSSWLQGRLKHERLPVWRC